MPYNKYATGDIKPYYRGMLHEKFFHWFIPFYSWILLYNCHTNKQYLTACTYLLGLNSCFGISTLYHRGNWSLKNELILQKIDHCAIYIYIASVYTPIAILLREKNYLYFLWINFLIGCIITFRKNIDKSKNWIYLLPYVYGSMSIFLYVYKLYDRVSFIYIYLIIMALVQNALGLITYKYKFFDKYEKSFGHHEYFHLFITFSAFTASIVNYKIITEYLL